jgi:hypothetical protein
MVHTYTLTFAVSRVDVDDPEETRIELIEDTESEGVRSHVEDPVEEPKGCYRYTVHQMFAADSDEEAREKVLEMIDNSAFDIDIFSVKDGKGNTILTEEDEE